MTTALGKFGKILHDKMLKMNKIPKKSRHKKNSSLHVYTSSKPSRPETTSQKIKKLLAGRGSRVTSSQKSKKMRNSNVSYNKDSTSVSQFS